MKIEKNKVVTFHYRMLNDQGDELERSDTDHPAVYLHGHKGMLIGIEKAMTGKAVGDSFEVTVSPDDGYGERKADAKERVSLKSVTLPGGDKIKGKVAPGTIVEVQGKQGSYPAIIIKMGLKTVDVDTNHPLAGQTLTFDIQINDIRDASQEEIDHGHAHGPGGHHH